MLTAALAVQTGAGIAKGLFDDLGPAGTVLLRTLFGAVVLVALWRPRVRGRARGDLAVAVTFGLVLAAMNLTFYLAIDRIPLGVAVTIEFAGPLAVAVAGSRRRLHVAWVVLAAAGILLLVRTGGGGTNLAGVLFALTAAACWAAYIILSQRAGRAFPRGEGLAIAMAVGTLALLPIGIGGAGSALLSIGPLAVGAGVGLLSSAIPYSLELEALRRLPSRVFGILLSLDPAIAALMGFVLLGQGLGPREIAGIALVVAASVGAAATADAPEPAEAMP
ncbi:MAG: inner rane transporter RhtA [Thermoleophilaceae bacterium]|nr:inner rane transporter RhtA [Thermoleophilaceae bacterium]MEA2389664.1 inner rane transporter RhtA [Thermoleophilaceae bacterium]